jgi:antitoxin MazE5
MKGIVEGVCSVPGLQVMAGEHPWHTYGMARTRISTTVDSELLDDARQLRSGLSDAALVDEALQALLARHRAAEIDESYVAYDEHPPQEPDAWGDLASFREAAGAS